jgi:hypothetical protein
MPKKIVEEQALSLLEPRTIRKREREIKAKEQKEQAERDAFKKLKFEDYRNQQRTQQDLIASLESRVQALTAEKDGWKEKYLNLKVEADSLRNSAKR